MFKRIRESKYEISEDGIIRNIGTGREMKYHVNHHGYFRISLDIGEGRKTYFVHRLVAEMFIPRIKGKNYINHINSNKKDNRVENLEWCTVQENNDHAYINNAKMSRKIPVKAININTGEELVFESMYQGAKYVSEEGIKQSKLEHVRNNIKFCCDGKAKTLKGYKWEYIK